MTMSLDGFMAPEDVPFEDVFSPQGQSDPRVRRWMAKWSELQAWVFPTRFFRENLKFGEGGEEGHRQRRRPGDLRAHRRERYGPRMFDAGELSWPEEAPFHTPVFVVTHTARDPWERPGGTTFHFVDDGIESALDQAREAAGDRDVRIVAAPRPSSSTWTRAWSTSSRSPSRRCCSAPASACSTMWTRTGSP